MTNNNYKKFAEMLNDALYSGEELTEQQDVLFNFLLDKIILIFQQDNKNFDKSKFELAVLGRF